MTPATPEFSAPPVGRLDTVLVHLLNSALACTADGEAIGQVSHAILDLRTGRIAFAVVALVPIDGALQAPRLAPVPWDLVTLGAGSATLTIATAAITVRSAPALEADGWQHPADASWETRVMRHYEADAAPRAHSFAEELGLRSPVRAARSPQT